MSDHRDDSSPPNVFKVWAEGVDESGMRGLVMGGMIVGSTLGGFAPDLWGGSAFSVSGVVFSLLGGIAGIWAGVKVSAYL